MQFQAPDHNAAIANLTARVAALEAKTTTVVPVVTPQAASIKAGFALSAVMATMTASGTPTSWAITGQTVNNATTVGYWAVSAGGVVTALAPAVAANIPKGAVVAILLTATNANGTSAPGSLDHQCRIGEFNGGRRQERPVLRLDEKLDQPVPSGDGVEVPAPGFDHRYTDTRYTDVTRLTAWSIAPAAKACLASMCCSTRRARRSGDGDCVQQHAGRMAPRRLDLCVLPAPSGGGRQRVGSQRASLGLAATGRSA